MPRQQTPATSNSPPPFPGFIMAQAIQTAAESYGYKPPKPNKTKINQCYDCHDKLEEKQFTYNYRYYCKSCYENIRQICSRCGEKEKEQLEFIDTIVESEDKQTQEILCKKCMSLLTRCGQDSCNISFGKDPKFICELCELPFCKIHIGSHNCSNREPSFLYHHYNGSRQTGSVEKAQFIKDPRYVGIELECVNGRPESLSNKLDRRIGVGHDGSLKGRWALEIQTPPANTSKLEKLIFHATKTLRMADYKVNKSCGVHIHLDSEDFMENPVKVFNIISLYYAIEPLIYAMLPKSRRENKYTLPLRNWLDEPKMMALSKKKMTMKQLEEEWFKTRNHSAVNMYKDNKYDSSRYHGCNLHALFAYGHIEMRYHHGTLNATKIINWINLHLLLVDWAINHYRKSVIDALFSAESPFGKLKLICRHLGLSNTLRRYVLRGLRKFSDADIEDEKV